jgi:hypothetical protein
LAYFTPSSTNPSSPRSSGARLVEGNSKRGVSRSAAPIAGPRIAGGLVQLIPAPQQQTA